MERYEKHWDSHSTTSNRSKNSEKNRCRGLRTFIRRRGFASAKSEPTSWMDWNVCRSLENLVIWNPIYSLRPWWFLVPTFPTKQGRGEFTLKNSLLGENIVSTLYRSLRLEAVHRSASQLNNKDSINFKKQLNKFPRKVTHTRSLVGKARTCLSMPLTCKQCNRNLLLAPPRVPSHPIFPFTKHLALANGTNVTFGRLPSPHLKRSSGVSTI